MTLTQAEAVAQTPPSARRSADQPVGPSSKRFTYPDDVPGGIEGVISLRRIWKVKRESFYLDSHISYRDEVLGTTFTVPNEGNEEFRTDFASIPQLFTWLVPKTGEFLPAAILHDGFIPITDNSYDGKRITRQQADRIFRDGMKDLGTGPLRRWLIWTAVAIATEAEQGFDLATHRFRTSPNQPPIQTATEAAAVKGVSDPIRGLWKLTRLFGLIFIILALATMATIDLFDQAALLPWMGNHSTSYEVLSGSLFAVLVPFASSILFFRSSVLRAALILGIAMAFLLHVTILVFFIYLLYSGAEAVSSVVRGHGGSRDALKWFAGLGSLLLALLIFVKLALWASWFGDDSFTWGLVSDIGGVIDDLAAGIWEIPGLIWLIPLLGFGVLIWLVNKSQKDSAETHTA